MAINGWKCVEMEMACNGWTWLNCYGVAGNHLKCVKFLEMANQFLKLPGNGWNGEKWLEEAKNVLTWIQ